MCLYNILNVNWMCSIPSLFFFLSAWPRNPECCHLSSGCHVWVLSQWVAQFTCRGGGRLHKCELGPASYKYPARLPNHQCASVPVQSVPCVSGDGTFGLKDVLLIWLGQYINKDGTFTISFYRLKTIWEKVFNFISNKILYSAQLIYSVYQTLLSK